MAQHFLSRDDRGRNHWWTYLLTALLVFTGIIGFGGLPLQIAVQMKGLTPEELSGMTMKNLASVFTKNEMLVFTMTPFLVGFLMLILAIRYVHRKPALSYFTTRRQIDLKRILAGFGIWGTLLGILFVIEYFQNPGVIRWNYKPESFFMLLAICVFLVPIQTGFEELLCRGYVLKSFGRSTRRGLIAIAMNALIFGALHLATTEFDQLGWYAMAFYIVSGIFAGLITVMDDGIELSWGFHTANNIMSLLIISNQWQSLPTDSLFLDTSEPTNAGAGLLIVMGVCYPIAVLAMAKLYKWKDCKKRLLG
jgi:uncharacterized protein